MRGRIVGRADRRIALAGVFALCVSACALTQYHNAANPGVSVRPVPQWVRAPSSGSYSFPPNTAFCRAMLHYSCYQPAQLQEAYRVKPLIERGLDGRGRTIVIVDSFGSPTIENDLRTFDRAFGLPDPPSLKIIQPAGPVPPFPQDPFGVNDRLDWASETTLDVEWTHVFAPGANILLVETPTSETEGIQGFPEIVNAENYVINHNLGDVISQSFGATEQTFPSKQSILALRGAFVNARRHHVTVLAGSGDSGATDRLLNTDCCYPFRVTSWPAADPLVTAIGGTQLHLDAHGRRLAPDNVWNDVARFGPGGLIGTGGGASGGGLSTVFPRPEFQDDVAGIVGRSRGVPDLSLSAAVDGGVDIFSSFCVSQSPTQRSLSCPQWQVFGGTSAATPEFAGIVAIADQAAHRRLGWLNPALYEAVHRDDRGGIVDITTGNNTYTFCSANCATPQHVDTTVPGFNAARGYDLASGLGTIDALDFILGDQKLKT